MDIIEGKLHPIISNKIDNNINDYVNNVFKIDTPEKILLIGDVQSGKTKAIIEIIRNACKNNYKIVIVFAGHVDLLTKQTYDRINESFDNESSYKVLHYENFDENLAEINQHYRYKNSVIIFNLLKSKAIIKNLDWINKIIRSHVPSSILVIDDEGDFFSLEKNDKKHIADNIKIWYNELDWNKKYISVTATPFDNIEFANINQYDRSVLLPFYKNDEYTGNNFFTQKKNFFIKLNENKCLKEKIRFSFEHWIINTCKLLNEAPALIKSTNIDDEKQKKIFEEQTSHSELVLNIDRYNDEHDNAYQYIKELIFDYEYLTKFAKENNIVLEQIRKILDHTFIYVINSSPKCYSVNCKKENDEKYDTHAHNFQIIIGGDCISRGLTISNLIVELLISNSKNISVDTLLQKARWLGYRKKIWKFMNVITTKDIIDKYSICDKYIDLIHENGNDIHKLKKYYNINGGFKL